MRLVRLKSAVVFLSALLIWATFSFAALPKPEDAQPGVSLVGQLLVATPEIGDPRFQHSVILIVRHNDAGALGLAINRPIGQRALARVMEAVGASGEGIEGSVDVYAGGPVEPWVGFVLHSGDYHRAGTIDIDGTVAMTSSPDTLRDIANGKGPQKSLVVFGYTGWGPGQLENELAQHGWFTTPDDPRLVFDEDRGKVWDEAAARQTFPL